MCKENYRLLSLAHQDLLNRKAKAIDEAARRYVEEQGIGE